MVGRVAIGPPPFAEELVKMAQDHYSNSADLAVKIKTAMEMGRAQALTKMGAAAATKLISKGRKAATKAVTKADDASRVVRKSSRATAKATPSAIQQATAAKGGVQGRAGEALSDLAPGQWRGRDDLISTPLNQKSMWSGISPELAAKSEASAARGMQNVQANRMAAMAPPSQTMSGATANIRPQPLPTQVSTPVGGVTRSTTAPTMVSTPPASMPTSTVGGVTAPAATAGAAPAPPVPAPAPAPARQGMSTAGKVGLGAAGLGAAGLGGAVAGSQQPQQGPKLPTPSMPNMMGKIGSVQLPPPPPRIASSKGSLLLVGAAGLGSLGIGLNDYRKYKRKEKMDALGRVHALAKKRSQGISKVGGINLGKKVVGGVGKAVRAISDPTELAMKGGWKAWKAAPTWGKGLMAAGAVGGVGTYYAGKKAYTGMAQSHHRYQRGAHQYGRYGTSPWKRSYQM